MKEPKIGSELRDVLELMVPAGDELRTFIEGWRYIQHGPPSPTCWNLLETIEAERSAKTKSGEILLEIRKLAHRSRNGDDQAAGILLALALECTLRLNMVSGQPDAVLLWLARHCRLWPVIDSTFPTRRRSRQELEQLGSGPDNPESAKARFSPESMATFMAGATAAYIELVRIGWRNPANRPWASQVRQLPVLSRGTAPRWWKVAKPEIARQFPDLAHFVLGHLSPETPKTDEEALRRIRYPFIQSVWQLLADDPQRRNGDEPRAEPRVKSVPNKRHAQHPMSHKRRSA